VPTPDLQLTTVPERWRPSDGQLTSLADFLLEAARRAVPPRALPMGPPPRWWCGCQVRHLPVRRLLVGVLRLEANGQLELIV
jgi:hypothetical protein